VSRRVQLILARTVLATLVGLGLALVESRVLWGYWIVRPSLCRELDTAGRVVAFSMVDFWPEGEWSVLAARRTAREDAERFCQPDSNECREGRLITCLRRREAEVDSLPELRQERYSVPTPSQVRQWEPEPEDRTYQQSSRPVRGVVIHFMRNGDEWLLVGYRTSERANDSYAYGEVLYRIGDRGADLVRHVRFLLDIGGVEGLDWPVLWPANAVVILLGTLVGQRIIRWTAWRRNGMHPSPAEPSRSPQ
jgi:hypothetical protein